MASSAPADNFAPHPVPDSIPPHPCVSTKLGSYSAALLADLPCHSSLARLVAVRPIPLKELGAVAVRPIAKGELVIEEAPLFRL